MEIILNIQIKSFVQPFQNIHRCWYDFFFLANNTVEVARTTIKNRIDSPIILWIELPYTNQLFSPVKFVDLKAIKHS